MNQPSTVLSEYPQKAYIFSFYVEYTTACFHLTPDARRSPRA